MLRRRLNPRPDWRERAEAMGFLFHTMDGVYWDESACYAFSAAQVDAIEAATNELHAMCLEAADHIVRQDLFEQLKIPAGFADLAARSWRDREPTLYGRFDLAYDGSGPAKMLEYNADTPTALFEASVVQWQWLQDVDAGKDQFNSLHEQLIQRWTEIAAMLPRGETVHFSCARDSLEDFCTTEYVRDTAAQAGLDTRQIYIDDIGSARGDDAFVDLENRPIQTIFKLYPWEWLAAEEFGRKLLPRPWRILEPAWKMLLANKGILAVLWQLYPDHPNLLPAFFTRDPLRSEYVQKPLYSREGANVTLMSKRGVIVSSGPYGDEGYVYQQYFPLPACDGRYPVIGSWIVGEKAAGMGIREDSSPITRNTSCFVPHYFD